MFKEKSAYYRNTLVRSNYFNNYLNIKQDNSFLIKFYENLLLSKNNNLHYGFYNELTKEEIKILDKQQDIYLNYVIDEFEKYMKLNLSLSHYLLLGLAFLDHWAKNNS